MTNINEGDRVEIRATGVVTSTWFTSLRATVRVDGGDPVSLPYEALTVIEPKDDPSTDPVGTIRFDQDVQYPLTKVSSNHWVWVDKTGGVYKRVDREAANTKVVYRPEQPAAAGKPKQIVVNRGSAEPDRSRRYTDTDGDQWHYDTNGGWTWKSCRSGDERPSGAPWSERTQISWSFPWTEVV